MEIVVMLWVAEKGGHLISLTDIPSEELATKYEVNASFCFVQANAEQLSKITNLIDARNLKIEIDSVYSLEDIAKAHEQSESGHTRGKIVLQIREEGS